MTSKYKLVVFVPLESADQVREAIGKAGGGRIGNYSFCSFSSIGVGRFLPTTGAQPNTGEIGKLNQVPEERIEVICEATQIDKIITAIKKVHPYEEAAYDLYPLVTREEIWS